MTNQDGRIQPPKTHLPIYPAILPVAFVLDIWKATSLDGSQLLRPVLLALGVSIVVTAVAMCIARSRGMGGVLAGFLVIGVIGGDDLRVPLLAAGGIAAVVALSRRDARWSKPIHWAKVTSLLNLVAVVTLGLVVGSAVLSSLDSNVAPVDHTTPTRVDPGAVSTGPDIVMLILDEHGRQDVLAETYDEDISPFVRYLEQHGFYVSPRSRSNYMTTGLTLVSMLNFAHLSELGLPPTADPTYPAAVRQRLSSNRAVELLKAWGYRTATVSSGYDGVSVRSVDAFFDGGQVSELELTLLMNTFLRDLLEWASPDALSEQIRARVQWNLDPSNWLPELLTRGDRRPPFFLLVHVPSPHAPYVFGRDGTPTSHPVELTGDVADSQRSLAQAAMHARAYSDQLAHVDGLAITSLDQILAMVPEDAVVIVMSDHGPEIYLDWSHLETTDTRERFGVLFAARTPGAEGLFEDAPTLVNVFPLLFNHYLGTALPLQRDVSFLGAPPYYEIAEVGNPDAP